MTEMQRLFFTMSTFWSVKHVFFFHVYVFYLFSKLRFYYFQKVQLSFLVQILTKLLVVSKYYYDTGKMIYSSLDFVKNTWVILTNIFDSMKQKHYTTIRDKTEGLDRQKSQFSFMKYCCNVHNHRRSNGNLQTIITDICI